MNQTIRGLGNTFLAGLLAILPLYLTIRALTWLFGYLDASAGNWIALVAGRRIVGAGVFVTLAVVFIVGLLVRSIGADRFSRVVDRIFTRVPGVGQLYSTIRSLLDPLAHPETRPFRDAVWVEVGPGMRVLGFVTSSQFEEAPGEEKRVNVYLPMSHPYVGYVVTLEPEKLRPADVAFEEVVSYHFSCGSALPRSYKETAAKGTG